MVFMQKSVHSATTYIQGKIGGNLFSACSKIFGHITSNPTLVPIGSNTRTARIAAFSSMQRLRIMQNIAIRCLLSTCAAKKFFGALTKRL